MDYSYENNFEETKIDFDIELITKKKKKKKKETILKLRSLWNESKFDMTRLFKWAE